MKYIFKKKSKNIYQMNSKRKRLPQPLKIIKKGKISADENNNTTHPREPKRIQPLIKQIINHPGYILLDDFRKSQIDSLSKRGEIMSKVDLIVSNDNSPECLKYFAKSVANSSKRLSRVDAHLLRNVWRHLFLNQQLNNDYLNY